MSPKDDRARIWDMLDAALRASEFTAGMSEAEFLGDARTFLAVERLLLTVGEAARHVSPEVMSVNSAIPWGQLIGQRNVLAHEYGDIDLEQVYDSIQRFLPDLIKNLERLLSELEAAE